MADPSANQPDSASGSGAAQTPSGELQPGSGAIARQAPSLLTGLSAEPLPVPVPAQPASGAPARDPRPAIDGRIWERAVNGVFYAGIAAIILAVCGGASLALIGFGPFDGVTARAFVPGSQMQFGRGGNAVEMLGRGWGRKDDEGGWSNSAVADLSLPVAAPGARMIVMQIQLDTRVDPRDPHLELQVLADGNTVFRRVYKASGRQVINVKAPLRRTAEGSHVLLTFVQDSATNAHFDDGDETLRLNAMKVSFTQ